MNNLFVIENFARTNSIIKEGRINIIPRHFGSVKIGPYIVTQRTFGEKLLTIASHITRGHGAMSPSACWKLEFVRRCSSLKVINIHGRFLTFPNKSVVPRADIGCFARKINR